MNCYYLLVALILLARCACATTWYASGTGTHTNGTVAQPWGLSYATTNAASNPYLQPGDTVMLQDGSYTCTETNNTYSVGKMLQFRVAGTAASKITYKAQNLWGFSFDGGLLFLPGASNIVVQGVRVHYSGISSRQKTTDTEIPEGITVYAPGVELLHNLVENTGHPGISSWKGTNGKLIAGNVIRFIGVNDFTGSYDGANRGSGMYLQNADNSSEALIRGNISYFNYTTGMKAYGNTDIWGFRFANNICVANHEAGIFAHQDNYGLTNLVVQTNFIWSGQPGIRIGYPLGNGGHSNAIVSANYCVESASGSRPFYMVDGWSYTTWAGNVGVQLSDRYIWTLEVSGEVNGNIASHTMSGNAYYGVNSGGFGSGSFFIKEVNKSLAEWKSETTTDSDATYTTGAPTELVSYVFRPSDDTDFVHVAVFNWPQSASTTVNLSSYFNANDRLDIYDAQNIPAVCSSVTFSGSTVTLPLNLTDKATMVGTFSNPAYTWNGFDARFRAFVIHRNTSTRTARSNGLRLGNLKGR